MIYFTIHVFGNLVKISCTVHFTSPGKGQKKISELSKKEKNALKNQSGSKTAGSVSFACSLTPPPPCPCPRLPRTLEDTGDYCRLCKCVSKCWLHLPIIKILGTHCANIPNRASALLLLFVFTCEIHPPFAAFLPKPSVPLLHGAEERVLWVHISSKTTVWCMDFPFKGDEYKFLKEGCDS